MSILDALKRGWWSGWAEFPELVAGGAGLLESLIPGDRPDDPLERLQEWGEESAKGLRLEGGEGRSEGLLEKISEGLGAAPGTLASMAPSLFIGGAPFQAGVKAGALGARIAAPAAGFGLHNLIRHGDEGLPTAIGHGLRGAAEGALFGGVGAKTAGMLVPKAAEAIIPKIKYLEGLGTPAAQRLASRLQGQLAETGIDTAGRVLGRKALHGLGTGGVVGGMTLAHGGDLEEATAGAATMGLLGLISSGKYRTPGATPEEMLGGAEAQIRRAAGRRKIEPLEAMKEGEWKPPVGEQPGFVDVAQAGAKYDAPSRTLASLKQFRDATPENQKILLERQNQELPHPLEAYQRTAVTPEQTFLLQERLMGIYQQRALLEQHKAQAKQIGDGARLEELQGKEADLATAEVASYENASGSATQAGRALANVRWGRKTQPEWVEAVRQFENQFGKENSKRFKELAMLSEGDPRLMQKLVTVVNRPKLWDYMMEYWINGLLSGPPTQMVNISSNMLRQGIDYAEKTAGLHSQIYLSKHAGLARGLGLDPKKIKTDLEYKDVAQVMAADRAAMYTSVKLLPKFLGATLREAEAAKLIEQYPEYAKRTKLDHPTAAIPGKPGEFIRLPGRMLQVMDMYFKSIAGQRAAQYTATRRAYEMFRKGEIKETEIEGKVAEFMGEGGNEPSQFILEAMKKEAEIQTFTEKVKGKFGTAVSAAREVPVRLPVLGLEVKPVQAVIPFWQTPWNVVTQSVARSPLGLLRLKGLKQKYETGKMDSTTYYKEAAGTVMGTAVWASLLGAAKMGMITGSGPTNYADRQNLLATGWRPYSLKLGDNYLPLQRIEPLGTVLGMAGDAAELGSTDDLTGKAIAMVKQNLTDKSFLYGLESFAAAFANPEQRGSTYYRQMSGSIVPTFFSKVAQAVDPYQRVQEAGGADAGVPDALAYRIPGVSRALQPRTTALGEKAERWGSIGTEGAFRQVTGAVQSIMSPIPFSLERKDIEVEKELNRLRGYRGMPPAAPKRKKQITLKGVSGENVKLTKDEYSVYDRWHQKAKQHLSRVIGTAQYERLSDDQKAKIIGSVYRKYRSVANKEIAVLIRKRTSVGG